VPVAIVGAFECWPRSRMFPRPGRVRLEFGKVISVAEAAAMDDRGLTAECDRRLRELDATARRIRNGLPVTDVPSARKRRERADD
jgi:1-acyl-sn-glycerol-3-phosphate acyltransferase